MIRTRLTATTNGREIVSEREVRGSISFAADSPTHLVRVVMNPNGGLIVNTSKKVGDGWLSADSIYYPTVTPHAAAPRKSHSVEQHDASQG